MSEEQSKSSLPETVVTEEEWAAWKDIPTTRTFRALLRKRLEERKADWVSGQFPTPERNAKAIGETQVLQAMLDLTADDINQGMSDE